MAAAYPRMGRTLAGLPAAGRTFAAFARASGVDVAAAACGACEEVLFRDRIWELAVVATEAAAFAAWRTSRRRVQGALGFSIGAYAALLAAGAVTVEQVVAMIDIVLEASRSLPGRFAMLAVSGTPLHEISPLLRPGEAELAAVVQPGQLLLAGRKAAIRQLAEAIGPAALTVRLLSVRWPLHTSLMLPVSGELERQRRRVGRLVPPRHPVYSAVDASRIETEGEAWRLLVDHLHMPQRFDLAFAAALSARPARFVEFGPTGTLTRAVRWLSHGEVAAAGFPEVGTRRRADARCG